MEMKKIELKELFIKALEISKNFQLAFRPAGAKFEENESAVVLLDIDSIDSYSGFSVGDLCRLEINASWYAKGVYEAVKHDFVLTDAYRIAVFVDLTGHLRQCPNIKLRDKFCALARLPRQKGGSHFIERIDERLNAPIALFWIGAIRKVKGE